MSKNITYILNSAHFPNGIIDKCNCFKIGEGLMELTVCPPTSAQCLSTHQLPNICPTSAQCLTNVCHMSPMSAQCSRCLPNVVCGQILDFFLYVLFILQLLNTDGMNTCSSIFMRTVG